MSKPNEPKYICVTKCAELDTLDPPEKHCTGNCKEDFLASEYADCCRCGNIPTLKEIEYDTTSDEDSNSTTDDIFKDVDFTNYYSEYFPILNDMIKILYDYASTGGCCHVVTDDDNIEDHSLQFVIDYAKTSDDIDAELSSAICSMMLKMTFLQRAVFFDATSEWCFDYMDKEYFDALYDSSEENLKKAYKKYKHI